MKRVFLSIVFISWMFGVAAQNINNPNKSGPLGTQVNTLTGNLFMPRNDIFISARGFDLRMAFYYNSYNFNEDFSYGNGWSFEYDIRYKTDSLGNKLIKWGDGREDKYTIQGGNNYKTPLGFYDSLSEYQPAKFRLQQLDRVNYYFDNATHKRITRVEEPNGNAVNFIYTDTLLTSLVNTAGQTISFTYNPNGRLATMIDAVASPSRTYTYTYDQAGNLKEVTDPLNGKNKYTYLTNGPMKTSSDKNNNVIDIIYYSDYSAREIIGCNKRISFSYDTLSRKTVATDHLSTGSNQVTTYTYKKLDNIGWITSMSGNCCGYNISYEYDDQGNKIKETDANGNVYKFTYDSRGNMLSITDPLGQVSSYVYENIYNNITRFTDNKGNVYSLAYDAKGNLIQLTAPGNLNYTGTYNVNGDIISSTDPKGNTYTYNYDVYGNPTNVTGPNGYSAVLSYNARGNLLAFTDARGNMHQLEFDILDRLKKITDPLNKDIRMNYDAEGNITGVINKNNESTLLSYDASNRVVKLKDPIGNQTEMTYDGMNNLLTAKNALGNAVNFNYDTRNRLINTKDPLNNNANYNYDKNGNITNITMPGGRTISYTYDALNWITAVTDNNGSIAKVEYDKNNNITSYTNATGATVSAVYDSLNRIKQVIDPLGNTSFYGFDKNGNIVSVTDRNGFTKNYTYDAFNRVKTFTDNNGFIITVDYDVQGNLTQVKDQNNNITTYAYDNLNRNISITYPDSKFMQYVYDVKNNVISKRLTDGSIIAYQYDSLNRIVSKSLPGGEIFTYTYDALSRMITATNNNGTVTLAYDKLDRVVSENYDGRTTTYSYDIAGRTQTTIYPDSTVVAKSFDIRNRLTSISKNNIPVVSYQYNNADQIINKTFANGISTNMQYDFANRLSSISTANGTIQNTTFTYDKERNRTSINRINSPSLSETFVYDNGYRITDYKRGVIGGTASSHNIYTYDAVGNRTSVNDNGINKTYTVNNLNQITNSNNGSQSITFLYDGKGNLIYDGSFYKTYDAEGRLIKDSSSPVSIINYGYDAFNRRVIKTTNGTLLKYTYCGLSQIEERDITNNILNKTIFTNFLSPVWNEKNGSDFYYHQNELNSVEVISNTTGRLVERYQYDLYGQPSRFDSLNNSLASSIAGNRIGFTGQEYDSASGNYRFFFRNYSPSTGTFNQRDLIGYGDGMGMYQYVGNNPANGVDVLGLECYYPGYNDHPVVLDREGLSNLDKTFSSFLSKTNFALGRIDAFQGDIESKIASFLEGVAEKGIAAKGVLRTYKNSAWSKAVLGKQYAKEVLLPLENAIVENATILKQNAVSGAKSVGKNISWAGEKLGVAEFGYKGIKFAGEMTNGISPAGQDEWNALGDFAFSGLTTFTPTGATVGNMDFLTEAGTGKNFFNHASDWVYNELIINERRNQLQAAKDSWNQSYSTPVSCPRPGGTRKLTPTGIFNLSDIFNAVTEIFSSYDPNEMIGPEGQPDVHWVSVKDRMPYTVLYENATIANAPAKYVRITTPIEPKQDANTFQLGNFGFNNTTFTIPANTASYYNRLDVRDSLGLFVDVTAGYDQMNNVAFWEFQSIDPITLQTPSDPLKGFLLLQDSTSLVNGHGFVNFSIKPKQSAITLDTIGARADIVFDNNDTIPTNIYTNTLDAFAPTSYMSTISANTNPITLSWSGTDDIGGSGIDFYTIYVSRDRVNYSVLIPRISRTDTTLVLPPDSNYCFFVLATDRVGNREILRPANIQCTSVGPPLPITWLYFNGKTVAKDNLLEWATANEQNSKQFDVERSLNGTLFNKIGAVSATGNSSQTRKYQYVDKDIDRLNSEYMFYRLKQIDINANFKYSNIVRLRYNEKITEPTIVYPNPTPGQVTILLGDKSLIGTNALIYDVSGRLLETIKISANNQQVDLSKYVNGTYLIKLSNKEVLRIIKQ